MTHLRPIAQPETTIPLREQPAPMLDWVKIADLRIDDRYQRPLTARNWAAIRAIAANFQWTAFTPIMCAPIEGGLYAVIDGQHRAHAAALCGIERVTATIVPVSPKDQAIAFVAVNSGIKVSAHQTFRAQLAAQTPEALAIAEACEEAGCTALTYPPSSNSRKPRELSNIGFLRACITKGQRAELVIALKAITAHDTQGKAALYTDYILAPLVGAILKSGVTDPARITRALNKRNPFKTLEAAERIAKEQNKPTASTKIQALAMDLANTE
jgi:hypothetical protein